MPIFATKGAHVYQLHQLTATVNLYDASRGDRLATQGAAGRFLWVSALASERTHVQLAEDEYWGWLDAEDYCHLTPATQPYQPIARDRADIEAVLEEVIAFCLAAQQVPHEYLWGGTVAPHYDCSGLMQASFASQGIWLPRDAYQQEAFATPLGSNSIAETLPQLQRGDLVFFGSCEKATHVGLYLGQGQYIHSSGKEYGRNGIGIDTLFPSEDPVSIAYQRQFRGGGRIEYSYLPLATHP
ncbi:NlpC/P60 family peptidase [Thermosynechococcus sp. NK55a]|jgi:cell wall-associated NlpC family hydrolase|uniref:C40 family peptidase n=1 Tax=unclassified Thermosynechococcus TaxID=2622553 RepID=UPI0003D93D4F|nr:MULTISPECIES: C40 family peptidase [unclassified Thermosynechococcus]AHB88807.1 NlpC/P60 family peptidase [Thermosynechococcus sp. NK55a]RMH66279.1 MAG: NlpC/P60 family protein [Cyanobacteria bacterium J003]HIK24046.1 C40 family peptidase [Thermosynechococcus sp. M3746_W2019_013]